MRDIVLNSSYISEKPGGNEIADAIKHEVVQRYFGAAASFINKYYDILLCSKNFYFLIDAFDEMPFLNSNISNSMRIDIQKQIVRFLEETGGGIIASRSKYSFVVNIQIKIKCLDEPSIHRVLTKHYKFSDDIVISIFSKRLDILELCKIPLNVMILSMFYQDSGCLPENLESLYEYYVGNNLNIAIYRECENGEAIGIIDIMKSIIMIATEIALNMQENDPSYFALQGQYDETLLRLLISSKIVRVRNGVLSFAHNKIRDYFILQEIKHKSQLRDEYIQQMFIKNGNQDIVGFYYEIAPANEAQNISDFCYKTISGPGVDFSCSWKHETDRALKALRFLFIHNAHNKEITNNVSSKITDLVLSYLRDSDWYKRHDLNTLNTFAQGIGYYLPENKQRMIQKGLFNINSNVMTYVLQSSLGIGVDRLYKARTDSDRTVYDIMSGKLFDKKNRSYYRLIIPSFEMKRKQIIIMTSLAVIIGALVVFGIVRFEMMNIMDVLEKNPISTLWVSISYHTGMICIIAFLAILFTAILVTIYEMFRDVYIYRSKETSSIRENIVELIISNTVIAALALIIPRSIIVVNILLYIFIGFIILCICLVMYNRHKEKVEKHKTEVKIEPMLSLKELENMKSVSRAKIAKMLSNGKYKKDDIVQCIIDNGITLFDDWCGLWINEQAKAKLDYYAANYMEE
ncbi:hypothetical protein AGMMS49992_29620 [Clostridia bacterium]|nr:hypothetical protein AGMMS49992_29620 [Clostridia bacterium]